MKRFFFISISVSLIVVVSVFGFLEIQKERGTEIARKKLDEFYIKELQRYYLWMLKEEGKDKSRNDFLVWWHEEIVTTKEHMSKDGYNWQQIKEMDKEAEWVAKDQLWNEEEGYEDGFAGKKMNHEKQSLLNDRNGRNLHYHIGYDKGKKARLNKLNNN